MALEFEPRWIADRCAAALLCLWVAAAPRPALAEAELRLMPGDTALEQQLGRYLTDSQIVTDLVTLMSENFTLEQPLGIIVGSRSDKLGVPSYSTEDKSIRLPYAYIESAIRAQAELVVGRSPDETAEAGQAVKRAMDMVEYTLYHLFAKALIDDENADADADGMAEAVASWVMISAWPDGAAQWVEDVQAFSDASQRLDGSLDEYWHAHSLYRLREQTLLCWALGAGGKAVEQALRVVTEPAERRERCRLSWAQLDQQMRQLLDPVLKPDAKLRAADQDD
jgi:hypothetical protein